MPRNGSGTYALPQPPFTPGTTILSAAVNSDLSDIATALTQSISADGQTSITGQLKTALTTSPGFSSTLDATTGFGVSIAGEADIFVGNTKVVTTTSTGQTVNGNKTITGTLGVTGATTLGTATITTETVTTENVTTLTVSGILTDTNTGYWVPPTGSTAQRPGGPSDGWSRYNSDNHQHEFWNGTSWQVLAGIFAPNFQIFTSGSAATYNTPTAGGNLPLYLRVRMAAGGGGGGASNTNAGQAGADSSFSNWTTIHGTGGAISGGATGGTGGTGGTNGTGTLIRRVAGPNGQWPAGSFPGPGGATPFGGAGVSSATGAGANASANTGSGGSGASGAAGGGAAGEYVEFIITTPAASYLYTVGGGGPGGAAGGNAGGNGAAGRIEVEAYWQ